MKIAITGSIGSGKSACSAYLRTLGYTVFDTDKMVHAYYEPDGKAYKELIDTFGTEILDDNKNVDRKVLAGIVFQDQVKLDQLEGILYPHLAQEILETNDSYDYIFYEVPVLFESGFEIYFDTTVMIDIDEDIALERLQGRGMALDDVKRRLKFQMSPQEKRDRADVIIENNSTVKAFHDKIEVFLNKLTKEAHDDSL